jgi:hypothetical protein
MGNIFEKRKKQEEQIKQHINSIEQQLEQYEQQYIDNINQHNQRMKVIEEYKEQIEQLQRKMPEVEEQIAKYLQTTMKTPLRKEEREQIEQCIYNINQQNRKTIDLCIMYKEKYSKNK